MGGERAMKWQQAMRERMEQRGIRPDPGFRGPQGGPGQYLPPQPGGGDRRMPARMGRPDSGPQSDRPRGPGDFHSPEGRREGGQQRPPMEERGPRPPGSGQRDVQ